MRSTSSGKKKDVVFSGCGGPKLHHITDSLVASMNISKSCTKRVCQETLTRDLTERKMKTKEEKVSHCKLTDFFQMIFH